MKSLYDNLKQKDGEGSKSGGWNASKGWFDNLKNVKITEASSADSDTIKMSLRRKDICLNKF